MKILFSGWPAHGHLLPMVPLARAAQQDGHDVLVASGSDVTDLIEGHGLAAAVTGRTLAQSYAAAAEANRADGLTDRFADMDPADAAAAAARSLFGGSAVARVPGLLDLIEWWRPELIVHDTLELAGPTAAQITGRPHATHSYGPLVPQSALMGQVLGRTIAQSGYPDPMPGIFAAPYLEVCPAGLQPDGTGPWTDVVAIRPWAGDVPAGATLPAGWPDLPHDDTVYVTLGTITNDEPDVFRAALDGCAAHPVNVVVTTGPRVDPAAVAGGRPGVLAVPYLPQALVLPHCTAVISHCGAGTMFGALAFGLPQLCLPHSTDQPFNAAAVQRAGAGLVLGPGEVSADAVGAALHRILGDGPVRAAARRIRAQIEAMPDPRAALRELLARVDG